MDYPLITTIIPTFNRSQLLAKAIESVLAQSYPHFKVYVLDNHSTDNTLEVVKHYQASHPNIIYIRHDENIGMMKNYEYGFSLIDTPYFHVLSDDDLIDKNFYHNALQAFDEYPELGLYAGSTRIVSAKNAFMREPNLNWPREGLWDKLTSTKEMIGKYPVPTTILFSSKILQAVQPDFSNSLFWDCDFLIHISLHYPIFLSKKMEGYFISHVNSYSKKPFFDLVYQALEKMLARLDAHKAVDPLVTVQISRRIKSDIRYSFRACLFDLIFERKFPELRDCFAKLQPYYNLAKDYTSVLLFYSLVRTLPAVRLTIPLLRGSKSLIRRLKVAAKGVAP